MLGEALQSLPAEVQAGVERIGAFERGQKADGVGVVIESARRFHLPFEHVLARMAERGMADVVGEAQGLGQILVEAQRACQRPADLRHFEAVGEADAEMVAVGRDEDLGLVAQAAEGDGMDDPVAVALESVARAPLGPRRLAVQPPPRSFRIAGIARERRHLAGSFSIFWPAALVQAKPVRLAALSWLMKA
jgi:hypothetical protein